MYINIIDTQFSTEYLEHLFNNLNLCFPSSLFSSQDIKDILDKIAKETGKY